jgi:hypothetical protein
VASMAAKTLGFAHHQAERTLSAAEDRNLGPQMTSSCEDLGAPEVEKVSASMGVPSRNKAQGGI